MKRIPDTFEELSPNQKEGFARIGFEVFKAKFCKVEVAKQYEYFHEAYLAYINR